MTNSDRLATLAHELVAEAAPPERTLTALVNGMTRLTRRLDESLEPVLGSLAFRTAMTRAARQAAQDYPFLRGIGIYEDGVDFADVAVGLSDDDYGEVRRGFEGLFEEFLRLMALQVGQGVLTRLLCERKR